KYGGHPGAMRRRAVTLPAAMAENVVQELRRTRRIRRLGDLEWFEIAYRVYLAALVGGGVVLWASDQVSDEPATAAQVAEVVDRGPAILGLALAAAVAIGLRSGSDGGPVSVEAADVRHLLLAPIPRRSVLARPVVQRLRAVAFGGAVTAGIGGVLTAPRLPGSTSAWAVSAAVAGAAVGTAFVAVAVLAHVARLPRWVATGMAIAVLAAQAGAIADWWPGPGDWIGSFALWGMRRRPADLVGLAIVGGSAAAAVAVSGRLRTEPLVRRADLVAQLHFAVTMQDLRTVMLLRRQLRGEHPRTDPWVRAGHRGRTGASAAVWRRGWRGLLRYPLARLARMAVLAVAAGLGGIAVLRGTTPAVVVVGVALYLLGLDVVEPLAQEVDHPDYTDGIPRSRGWVMARHIGAPAVALVPFAAVAGAVVVVARPPEWPLAAALMLPITLGGACGAVVSIVRDTPDPLAATTATAATAVPPEFAGFTNTMRLLWPVAVSTLAAMPLVAVREQPGGGTAARSASAVVILGAAVVWWVRRRDEWHVRLRAFFDAGRRTTGPSASRP
ncbi:MAG: hypothetical protein ABWZ99_09135, partial [Ilumatobacteraceae bacterium]